MGGACRLSQHFTQHEDCSRVCCPGLRFTRRAGPGRPPGTVQGMRPAAQDVRPGNRDALAISQRNGAVRSPVARWKGNVVSYTPVKSRRSQKQRLQHNSASRAALSPHEWDARLLGAARLVTQHTSVGLSMPMADNLDNGGSHTTCHRASTHSSFSSSLAGQQNHMENGPNFTDGKHFHMVGACCSLMVQTRANQRY